MDEEATCGLVAAYERLRSAATGTQGQGRIHAGLGVLRCRGMVAWMQVVDSLRSSPRVSAAPGVCPGPSVPAGSTPEMVTLLTQMVMATTLGRRA